MLSFSNELGILHHINLKARRHPLPPTTTFRGDLVDLWINNRLYSHEHDYDYHCLVSISSIPEWRQCLAFTLMVKVWPGRFNESIFYLIDVLCRCFFFCPVTIDDVISKRVRKGIIIISLSILREREREIVGKLTRVWLIGRSMYVWYHIL